MKLTSLEREGEKRLTACSITDITPVMAARSANVDTAVK